MNMPYQLVVFDWEGTLGDPLGHIHEALKTESEALGLGVYDVELARRYVTLGLDKAVRKIFPDLALYQYERLLAGVQQALVSHHRAVYLFPGVRHLLEQLRKAGVDMAIATNASTAACFTCQRVRKIFLGYAFSRSGTR